MTGKQLTKWMKEHGVRVADLAHTTGLGTNTVYAFRREESVATSSRMAILRFVSDFEAKAKEGRKAVAVK